jgi:hypothetical protein
VRVTVRLERRGPVAPAPRVSSGDASQAMPPRGPVLGSMSLGTRVTVRDLPAPSAILR